MKSKKAFILFVILLSSLSLSGCSVVESAYNNVTGLVGLNDTCTVIAVRAQIRSSFAVVAADLLEVKRGETLDVFEETDFEKVHWYRVRARDEDQTEGWIEAQNVITNKLLEKSKKLAEEFKNSQAQATGQLRAASNLRLSPDMNSENLLFKLDNGSTFEIIDWTFVPKAQDVSEVDDANKGEQKQTKGKTRNEEIEAAKEDDDVEKLEEKYDVWYQVRLDPSVSPAPVGWLFGRQVELQVPSDIVFYQHNNKKFVTWQRLDDSAIDKVGDKSEKLSKPSSWVILWRTNQVKAIDGVEPDFDGILVLGFDKYDQLHYTVYTTRNDTSVWGLLPLKVEGAGDNKSFTVKLRNTTTGQLEDKRFVVTSDKTRMRVTPPPDIANYEKKEK
ncbi:MAG TPA: SH3 domain-containing protein [Pyrinomonadaceae bacterium]|jgi:hypothetical protein